VQKDKGRHSIVRRDKCNKMIVHKLDGETEQRDALRNASESKMISLGFNSLIESRL